MGWSTLGEVTNVYLEEVSGGRHAVLRKKIPRYGCPHTHIGSPVRHKS